MPKYFFILGSNPTLSAAEVSAVLDAPDKINLQDNVLIYSTGQKLEAEFLIKRLGGTIKIGEITADLVSPNAEQTFKTILGLIEPSEKKFYFGFSVYGGTYDVRPLAMAVKKHLREKGAVCRWVISRELALSSVVVEQNKLLKQGVEIIFLKKPSGWLIGRTMAVQPFKELSARDYGRPARDDRSGMLPPKLAQIMINLALPRSPSTSLERGPGGEGLAEGEGRGEVILDPFCGSGTILTEAILMGYNNLIGADISAKATEDAKKNIEWTKKRYAIRDTRYELHNQSAAELSSIIKRNSVDAIITEPYLGPQRGKFNVARIIKELEHLYSGALGEYKKILKPDGKIVMIWPVFRESHIANRTSRIAHRVFPNLLGFKIINPVPTVLRQNKTIKLTDRDTIIYGRPDQKIWREIVVLK
jgi:tRNA G10  N-methylase Trm11